MPLFLFFFSSSSIYLFILIYIFRGGVALVEYNRLTQGKDTKKTQIFILGEITIPDPPKTLISLTRREI